MRRYFPSILIVIATLVVLIILWELREALVLFLFSLVVAAASRSPVNFFVRRGLPNSLAILLTYLLGLGLLVGLIYAAGRPVLRDLQMATDSFDRLYRQLTTNWPNGTAFQQTIAAQLPPPQDLYDAIAGGQGMQLLQNFLGIASGLLGSLAKVAIVLVLSIYWSFDRRRFEGQWVSLLPADKRRKAREVMHDLEERIGGYIRSEIIQSILAGLLLGAGYYALGLNFPGLIALIGALLWLIPWLGAVLAMLLPLLVGLTQGTGLAVAAPVYTIIILVILERVVEPRLVDRRRYSSLLTIIVMVAMAEVYGLMGLLLAPPLAAAIQTIYVSLMRTASTPVQPADLNILVDTLHQRVATVQEQVACMEEEPSPEVVSLLGRLNKVMEQAEQFLQTDGVTEAGLNRQTR